MRNREKCIQARRDIVVETKNRQVFCRQCDLADPESIRAFVAKLSHGDCASRGENGVAGKFELDRIDGLVNNAAVLDPSRSLTPSGIERTFAINHLGSFLLTGLLLEKFLAQKPTPVRIVFVNTNLIDTK